ncbi:MAG: type I-C CRISPR-associated protein Cas8c/Csd1 [Dehalococcoidia bacterium]
MLLQKLAEYATRAGLPPPLHTERAARYIVALGEDGRLLSPEPLDTADAGDRKAARGMKRLLPNVQRSVAIKPLLLSDKADYVLGLAAEGKDEARAGRAHSAFMAQLARCVEATREPSVRAVEAFLKDDPLDKLSLPEDFDRGATVIFRVGDDYPTDLESVQEFWAAENDDPDAPVMQCLVCGQRRPVLDRLQAKIKGVPGGHSSGTSIISANAPAFESYGLEASLIAPTCASCGERFTQALNSLLGNDRHRIGMAGAAFVFWTRVDQPGVDVVAMFKEPQIEQVREFMKTLRGGGRLPAVEASEFFAVVLSGSGGRAVVRDWIDTTVGDVKENLGRWFEGQKLAVEGEEWKPLGLYALAGATVRELRDVPTTTYRALIRSALTRAPLPSGILYQAVRRSRAEQKVTRNRASLIKLYFSLQRRDGRENWMTDLNLDVPNAAFQCGRLLAVLEQAQLAAIPGINSTIVDRFFGTASSAPNRVFPRLLTGAQPHLAKLQRIRRPAAIALQRRIEEIIAHLPVEQDARTKLYRGFPRVLTLEDQGLFSLGYYQQRAADRARMDAARKRKQEGAPSDPDAALGEIIEESETEEN